MLPDQKHDKSQAPQAAALLLCSRLTRNLTYHSSAVFLRLEEPEREEFVSTEWQKPGTLGKYRSHPAAHPAVGLGSGLGRDLCVMLTDSRAEKIQASHINTPWAASNTVIVLAGWNCVIRLFLVRYYASGIYFI